MHLILLSTITFIDNRWDNVTDDLFPTICSGGDKRDDGAKTKIDGAVFQF